MAYLIRVTEFIQQPFNFIIDDAICREFKAEFSSVKALLKADREKEIEQYGKQVSMRPSKVHKSKRDYDRKRNKVNKDDLVM